MAGMNFEYDERGGTFYYFLVSFYALVLIPATYYLWPRSSKKKEGASDLKSCRCEPCLVKDSMKKSKEPWKKWKQRFVNIFMLVAWIGFASLAYKAAHIENDHVEWDPYAVLGLDRGASVEEVKKAYRQLTKIHHPDKGGEEKRFVEITKAHLSLTDEESKKNYDMYGNPDGPGAQTFGIALPSWLVSKEYSFLVLAAYGLVFMIILPVCVGVWWYRSIRYSADSVLMKTTELFAHMEHKTSFLNIKRVITILSGAYEFWKLCNKEITERPSDDVEVPMLMKQFPSISENKREGPFFMPYSLKARVLMYAHLSRRSLPADTLNKDLQYILKKCSYLIQELIQVYSQLYMYAAAGRVMRTPALETLDNIMKVSPLVVQAMWESKNPLLQLPHITEDVLRRFVLKKKRHIKTCSSLAALTNEERREALRGISDSQYQDVLTVLASMPHIEMEVIVEVKDDEDKTITAGALVTAIVRLKRTPLLDPSVVKSFYQKTAQFSSSYQVQPIHHHHHRSNLPSYSTNPTSINSSRNNNSYIVTTNDNDENRSDDLEDEEIEELLDGLDEDDAAATGEAAAATGSKQQLQNDNNKPKSKNIWEKNKKKKGGKNKPKAKQQQQQQQKKLAAAAATAKLASPAKKSDVQTKDEKSHGVEEEKQHSGDESDSEAYSSDEENVKQAVKESKVEENDYDPDDDGLLLDEDFSRKEKILEAKSKITHLVHCPYYPEDKYEWWWVYICDRKKRQLVCPPVRVTTLVNEEEVELRFPAQRTPGVYSVQVCLRSDSYVDCDINKDVRYTVTEAKQITSHPQWEFPEDDETKSADEISEEASEYTEEDEDLSDD